MRKGILDRADFKLLYDEIDKRDGYADGRAKGETLPATDGKAGG